MQLLPAMSALALSPVQSLRGHAKPESEPEMRMSGQNGARSPDRCGRRRTRQPGCGVRPK
eukprot:9317014-Prorocentrum_lima.AAC.1